MADNQNLYSENVIFYFQNQFNWWVLCLEPLREHRIPIYLFFVNDLSLFSQKDLLNSSLGVEMLKLHSSVMLLVIFDVWTIYATWHGNLFVPARNNTKKWVCVCVCALVWHHATLYSHYLHLSSFISLQHAEVELLRCEARPADDRVSVFHISCCFPPAVRSRWGDIWVTAGCEVEHQTPPERPQSAKRARGRHDVSVGITSHLAPSKARVSGQISSCNRQDGKTATSVRCSLYA